MSEQILAYIFTIVIFAIVESLILLAEYIEYKMPIERIRRHRIAYLTSIKMRLENKQYSIVSVVYTKEKRRKRAEKKLESIKIKINKVQEKIDYLINYGEKEKPTQEVDLK